jgi:hypothetical protein
VITVNSAMKEDVLPVLEDICLSTQPSVNCLANLDAIDAMMSISVFASSVIVKWYYSRINVSLDQSVGMDFSIRLLRNAMMGTAIVTMDAAKTVRLKRITTAISILIIWES